jgi:hypothetical protein
VIARVVKEINNAQSRHLLYLALDNITLYLLPGIGLFSASSLATNT